MSYEVREEGGFSVVHLQGEIDLSCSPRARETILSSLKNGGDVLVDLSAVTYIDSSGVASLVEAYQAAKKGKQRFGLVGVSDAAMSVLQLARLDKVFPIHDNIEQCAANLG